MTSDRTIRITTRGAAGPTVTGGFDLIFTANPRAARATGTRHRSLAEHAQIQLSGAGLAIAPPLTAGRLLRQALKQMGDPDPRGSGRQHRSTVSELLRLAVPPAALTSIGPRGERLAELLHHYIQLLRAQQLIDPAELYWQAAGSLDARARAAVLGFTHLGPAEISYLDTLAGPGSLIELPGADTLPGAFRYHNNEFTQQQLQSLGWKTEQTTAEPVQPPRIQALAYPDAATEVRSVLTQAKQLLSQGVPAEDIVLLTGDEASYGPLVQAVAWEYGLTVNSFEPVPLAHTRLGDLIATVIEVVSDHFPFEATLRLTRHAFGPQLDPEAWRQGRRQAASGQRAWQELGLETAGLNWPGQASMSQYSQLLRELLESWRAPSRAAREAHDALALEALLDGLDSLNHLHGFETTISGDQFGEDILELLSVLNVPAAPGRGGLELHNPISLSGASYPFVFVLGATEGSFPARLSDDPVLPWHLRARLPSLDSIDRTVNREHASFRSALAAATQSLQISVPAQTNGRATEPGPLLDELGLQPERSVKSLLASPEEQLRQDLQQPASPSEPETLTAVRQAHKVELNRETASGFDSFDGLTGVPQDPSARTFSASQLTMLGQCPFKWFAAYVLQLQPEEEASAAVDATLIGSLYHNTLEIALNNLLETGATDHRDRLAAALPAAFEAAETAVGFEKADLTRLPGWQVLRREYLGKLTRAVEAPEFWSGEPISSEHRFESNWRGLQVRGTVDRIDRTEHGLIFIDYKSGSYIGRVQDENCELKLDLQLPMYREAAINGFPGEQAAGSRYYSINQAKNLNQKPPAPQELDDFVARARELITNGDFPVEPDISLEACTYCEYAQVCRIGERQAHKQRHGAKL